MQAGDHGEQEDAAVVSPHQAHCACSEAAQFSSQQAEQIPGVRVHIIVPLSHFPTPRQ